MPKLTKLFIIAALMGAVLLAFGYAGGWLSPHRLGPTKIIQAFEKSGVVKPGFRRNHAKGLCVTGYFDSNGADVRYSKAAVFAPGKIPVVGRFALAGSPPFQPDTPKSVRSFALQFLLPDGEEWRTGMNAIPVFPVNTPQAFYEQLVASQPDPATGKPDPKAMAQFLAAHPEAARAVKLIGSQTPSSGFANSSFNSLDAFRFISASGDSVAVRWSVVPYQPFTTEAPAPEGRSPNYLFEDLIATLQHQPLQWHLIVTIAQAADITSDATTAWPADRQQVDVGTLTIDQAQAEAEGNCRDINFDPLILPEGIAPSDDPLLSARSAAYSRSFTLRAGEHKVPSAVQITQGTGGPQP